MYTYMTAKNLGGQHYQELLQKAEARRMKVGSSWQQSLRNLMDRVRLALAGILKIAPQRTMARSHRIL